MTQGESEGRACSAPPTSATWRPHSGIRPTKQRGQNFVIDANTVRRIVRAAAVTSDDRCSRWVPGSARSPWRCWRPARGSPRSRSTRRWPPRCPGTVAEPGCRTTPSRLALVEADAMRIGDDPGPAPTALVANLPYNVAVPGAAAPAGPGAAARAGPGDGAGRGRRPAGGRPGLEDLRRPVGEGGVVRGAAAGRRGRPQRLLAGAERRLRAGGLDSSPTRRTAAASREEVFARGRRRLRPAPQDAARRAAGCGYPAAAAAEAARWAPPSTRRPAGRSSASTSSPASPRTLRARGGRPWVNDAVMVVRPGQGQPVSRGGSLGAPTASTTWPTSSWRSASTTRSP